MSADPNGSSDRLWLGFAVSSILLLVVLAVSPVKDYFREYRGFQNGYRARLLAAAGTSKELAEARAETVGIRQVWIPKLNGHVDRCTTCHLGVENPKMKGARAALPLSSPDPPHPGRLREVRLRELPPGPGAGDDPRRGPR